MQRCRLPISTGCKVAAAKTYPEQAAATVKNVGINHRSRVFAHRPNLSQPKDHESQGADGAPAHVRERHPGIH
jgi:hypothetical protein